MEQETEDDRESVERDLIGIINHQLAETELALRSTLEFFDRIEGSELSSRLGAADIRSRLLADLERIEKERHRTD